MDWNKILSRAGEMQTRMHRELSELIVEASAGAGMVQVRMNGMKQLLSLTLDPEVVDPADVATLQSLVLSAVNEASRSVDEAVKDKLGQVAGGFPGLLGM